MASGLNKEEGSKWQCSYSVRVSRKERVAAVLPLQEHWLPLSNLDLLLPPLHYDVFSCYKKPTNGLSFSGMVSGLKAALAQTLVSYYPLAGELVSNSHGEPELLCNNHGVDFIEAHADVELRDLCLYNPDQSVEGKLVPTKLEGLLCIQATELKCGGIVVACMFDHRIADAHSANMFLVAWAEIAGARPISVTPSFRRSLLNPRRPGCHDESFNLLYMPISLLPLITPASCSENGDHSISRIYCITAEDLQAMQAAASAGSSSKRSKLEAFSAFLWRIIGKAVSKLTAPSPPGDGCRMGIVVDGRARLGSPMDNYFGNVLSIPYGSLSLDELESMQLCHVADKVHEFLGEAVTEEHFRGMIDWVESIRPDRAVAKIYLDEKTPSLVVSSGQRFPVANLDFGWGSPVLASYHFPWGSSTGYVMPMPMPCGRGDWVVYVHLPSRLIKALEDESGHVFRRLTADHLGLTSTVDTINHGRCCCPGTSVTVPN
ncbi:putative alcohol O-acetyltransferase [Dioscorea sansibarensis]